MRFYPLEKLINLHDGYIRKFKIDELQLLLIKHRGELYLLEALCPHRNYPLDEALITDGVIRCPSHQYEFSMVDGRLLRATEDACRGLRTFTVIYEGNEVGVMLDRA
jgi:nitrite reductase/ring-hydroxylating ferredoxin subunit